MGRLTLKQPEQALKIAQAVQAWQRNAVSKRSPIKKLAEKIGVSVAVVRRVMVNTRKTVRKAEERCKLRKKIASESKKDKKTQADSKHQTTPKLIKSLNLTTVSSRTARRDRQAALQERKHRRKARKEA